MKVITCPVCGNGVSAEVAHCPECGADPRLPREEARADLERRAREQPWLAASPSGHAEPPASVGEPRSTVWAIRIGGPYLLALWVSSGSPPFGVLGLGGVDLVFFPLIIASFAVAPPVLVLSLYGAFAAWSRGTHRTLVAVSLVVALGCLVAFASFVSADWRLH